MLHYSQAMQPHGVQMHGIAAVLVTFYVFAAIVRAAIHTSTPTSCTALFPDGTLVERQLLAFQHIAIHAPTLAWPASHNSVETTSLKLPLKRWLDLALALESVRLLRLNALALLHFLLCLLLLPSPAERLAVMCLIPLPERRSIDLHNSGAGQGVRAHELVVRRMEGDGNDTHFARDAL